MLVITVMICALHDCGPGPQRWTSWLWYLSWFHYRMPQSRCTALELYGPQHYVSNNSYDITNNDIITTTSTFTYEQTPTHWHTHCHTYQQIWNKISNKISESKLVLASCEQATCSRWCWICTWIWWQIQFQWGMASMDYHEIDHNNTHTGTQLWELW